MDQEEIEEVEQEEFIRVFKSSMSEMTTSNTFLGKVSRACVLCGDIKLYKEFNNSHDPNTLCNYCAWDKLEAKSSYDELDLLEDQIIENEREYEEALERQELIDEVLRQLDE